MSVASNFAHADGRLHLYRVNRDLADQIRRGAIMNAPPLVAKFSRAWGVRIEPRGAEDWDYKACPGPDWLDRHE